MTTDTDHAAPTTLSVLPTHEMERLPWTPVPVRPAVDEKTLWQLGDFVVALVTDSPGSSSPGQGDLVAQHHLGVVSGTCSLAGRRLEAGSYVHVAPGAEQEVGEVGPEGCRLMQMHRPHPLQEAELLRG